jgi:hypothetical protein
MIQAGAQAVVDAADVTEAQRATDAAVGYCLRLIAASPVP